MPRDLSIVDAVQTQACNFTGCITCPFRVLPYLDHGCIQPSGGSNLSAAIDLAKLLQRDTQAIGQLINVELAEIETDETDYQLMSVAQAQRFIQWIDELLLASKKLYDPNTYFLHPEYETIANEKAGWWLEQGRDSDGTMRTGLSRLIFSLQSIRYFLAQAIEKNYAVEVGRYTFGKLHREPLK